MEFRTFQKQWGAEFISDDVVRFRVWAEGQKNLVLRVGENDIPMTTPGDGWFQVDVPGVTHGAEYQFILQDGTALPDPASRAQKGDVTSCTSALLRQKAPSAPPWINCPIWRSLG